MDFTAIISLIISTLLGSGLGSLLTLRASRKKASAEADMTAAQVKTTELDNVQEAVKIWREMAESLREELAQSRNDYKTVTDQVMILRKEVVKLTSINNRIVKLLDKITPDNFERLIQELKKELHETTENPV